MRVELFRKFQGMEFRDLSAMLFRSAGPEEAAAGDKRARTDLFREKLL